MKILFYGIILFCIAFLIHLLLWKMRIPKNQIKVLLQIFLGVLIISSLILWINHQLINLSEYLHTALFFLSLAMAYVATYSAIEVNSPSLVMVLNIAKTKTKGLSREEMESMLTDEILIKPRIRDLVNAGMASIEGNKFKLTVKGNLFIQIFIFFRKLLGLGKGG